MMRDKLFFFDIDGTLAKRGVICEDNAVCLKELRKMGYEVFICSGRPPFYVRDLFNDLSDGCICCNGRYILYLSERLFAKPFTPEELGFYLAEFKKLECGYLLVSETSYYCGGLTESYVKRMNEDYGLSRQQFSIKGNEWLTFDICYRDEEHLGKIEKAFRDRLILNDHKGIFSADCSTLDFDKGSAIEWLRVHFGLEKENIYVFGDGYNDQAMFREAGHRIAMGNAVEELKEKATYITGDFDKGGIRKALEYEGIF